MEAGGKTETTRDVFGLRRVRALRPLYTECGGDRSKSDRAIRRLIGARRRLFLQVFHEPTSFSRRRRIETIGAKAGHSIYPSRSCLQPISNVVIIPAFISKNSDIEIAIKQSQPSWPYRTARLQFAGLRQERGLIDYGVISGQSSKLEGRGTLSSNHRSQDER